MTLAITDITNRVKGHPDYDGHESIILAEDRDARFRSYIAIHNTYRGPALGGCRYWSRYQNDDEALTDVLRLSRGMTYKNALADLPLGGGKAVIIGQPGTRAPTPDMMRILGRAVDALQGRYITAEDVGMSVDLMLVARGVTRHVSGLPIDVAASGLIPDHIGATDKPQADPSPYTATGVYHAMRAAVKHRLGRDDMRGLRVSVKGYGNVAKSLCALLKGAGALVTVSEIDDRRLQQARADGHTVLDHGIDIMHQPADIFSPCALGGDIRDDSIQALYKAGVKIVCGGANNQLSEAHHAERLRERGILYTPDYLANAGGVISVGVQYVWSESPARETFPAHDKIMHRIAGLYDEALAIFKHYEETGINTAHIANQIAEERFGVKGLKKVAAIA